MPSKRISEFSGSDGTALATDELLVARGGANYKFALRALIDNGGWHSDSNTWTYLSATTFQLSGFDATVVFSTGTRIRLKQGGAYKYFVVTGSVFSGGNTTVTITGGTDYTLANAAITDNYYSYAVNPQGYPGWFAYVPTWTSTGTQPALGNGTADGKFCVDGRTCHFYCRILAGSTSTFGTGLLLVGLPVSNVGIGHVTARIQNASIADYLGIALGGNTALDFAPQFDIHTTEANYWTPTFPFTFADGDAIRLQGTYEI